MTRFASTFTLSPRFLTTASLLAALAMSTASAGYADDKDWKIEIRPLETRAAVPVAAVASSPQPAAEGTVPAASGALVPRMTYLEAMAQIPFNREEYEANPSYRHDAALEMMFGAMRPTAIIRQNIPYFSRYPDFFRNRFQVFPYPGAQSPSFNMYYNWSTSAISY